MRWLPVRSRPRHLRTPARHARPSTRPGTLREAATLAVLALVGGALLACGFWVTGAGALFDSAPVLPSPETRPATTTEPVVDPAVDPGPAVAEPDAAEVEGGPDAAPAP